MNHEFMKLGILSFVLGAFGCQTTTATQATIKLDYDALNTEVVDLASTSTKCALAMLVLDNESYSSIDDVYFDIGDTYGELMAPLTDGAKKKILDNVAIRANKYSKLHYDGETFPVMLEYTFSQECNHLYFSDNFKSKYSEIIEPLK